MVNAYFKYIPNFISQKWVTPLGCAIITQNWDMIEFLLEKDPGAHAVDKFGNTPLIQAALAAGWTSYSMTNLWQVLKEDSRTDIQSSNKVSKYVMNMHPSS